MIASSQPALSKRRALVVAGVALVVLIAAVVGVLWVRKAFVPVSESVAPIATTALPAASSTTASASPSPTAATTTGSPTASTSAGAAGPSAVPAAEPTQQFVGAGHTATFRYFAVTVLNEGPAAPVDTKAGLKVRVCVRELPPGSTGAVRISRDPWRLVSDKNQTATPAASGLYEPAFPVETTKAVGECQQGFLTFVIPPDFFNDSSTLVYANGLGEVASWNFH